MPTARSSHILHRTPWQPPVAVSGQGIYIELQDGTKLIDGVGGAAVACLGNGHPKVVKALKDQLDKVSCAYFGPADAILSSDVTRRLQHAADE